MAIWPLTLPQRPDKDGYEEQPPDLAIRSQMDASIDKVRRRFTAGVTKIAAGFTMTTAQTITVDEFYEDGLQGGVDQFEWTNPRTSLLKNYRLVGRPKHQYMDFDQWKTTVQMEQMP